MSTPSSRFPVGSVVKVIELPPFLKTADPMPMLRSANLIQVNETGLIQDQRPGGYYGVRFTHGTFLVDHRYLAIVSDAERDAESDPQADPK